MEFAEELAVRLEGEVAFVERLGAGTGGDWGRGIAGGFSVVSCGDVKGHAKASTARRAMPKSARVFSIGSLPECVFAEL